MKNQNHQQNNIHQFIIALQRDKLDLQSQLQLTRTEFEGKKVEAEKLQKDLRQLKEKYYNLKKSNEKNKDKSSVGDEQPPQTELISNSTADIVMSIDGKATPSKKKKKKRHGSTLSSTGSVSSLADKEELDINEVGEQEKESENAGKFCTIFCE